MGVGDLRGWGVLAIIALGFAFAGGLVPGWLHILAACVLSLILAGAIVAGAYRMMESLAVSAFSHAIVHVAAAAACVLCGTGLVYLNVRVTSPETLPAFVRGPIYWTIVWWILLYVLMAVVVRARQTRAELRERELAATRAELQALRARLDPHFLFNTLHSLGALIRVNPDAAEDAIEHFADMMRYVLRITRADADVCLADEIRFVRDYLALEELRFGERLRVVEAFEDDALASRVPPLLLQPLVENAVRHGIGPVPEGGTIRLAAWCQGDMLNLEVADDGRGPGNSETRDEGGIGLDSVRRQLAARYPGRYRFAPTTPREGGFVIRLTLPRKRVGTLRTTERP